MVEDHIVEVGELQVRFSVFALAEACAQAVREFIRPLDYPCGSCTMFNVHTTQCVECGWLRPLPGDTFREVPLGTWKVSRLIPGQPLTRDEHQYLDNLGV